MRYSLIVGGLRERWGVIHWLEGVGGMLGCCLPILSRILVTSWSDGFSENAHRPTQEKSCLAGQVSGWYMHGVLCELSIWHRRGYVVSVIEEVLVRTRYVQYIPAQYARLYFFSCRLERLTYHP